MKCEYCGADIIITGDGSLATRGTIICPSCGYANARGSWVCLDCGKVLTTDLERLREIRKKLRFGLERSKSFMPTMVRSRIKPNEFVYFTVKGSGENCYVCTDERLIKYESRQYWESPWTEVVSIGNIQSKIGIFQGSLEFEVNTFKETIRFSFGSLDAQLCGTFYAWINKALENHNMRKKDFRAIICSLSLGSEEERENRE